MKKLIIAMMMTMLMFPAAVMAMSHGEHGDTDKKMDHGSMDHGSMDHGSMDHGSMDHGKMDHGKMDHGKMGGMGMGGKMIVLDDAEADGVMAAAHMMDVKEKMAKHGMKHTHHLMVGFMDKEGEALDEGQVAVKVKGPDGKTSKPVKMMGMKGQFGADIIVDQPGMYMFMVGTKLEDGKKRTFHLHYDNK